MYPERPTPRKLAPKRLLAIGIMLLPFTLCAQSVSEIITDYNGYWKSAHQNQNPVRPDNSHNLLAFKYEGVLYSTGVNDSLLTANGETFISANIKALPVSSITGAVNSNTKIGLAALYDGVMNGPSAVRPQNNLPKYLTDGTRGLDLGTCVANLPAGNIFLPITNLRSEAVGDGIPDLLITQVADPSTTSLDRYGFTDINGSPVGNTVEIVLNNLKVVGHWTADFYEASTNPMQLSSGFTQTDRPIRLWVADFSEFGITAADLPHIAYFKIRLNGNSDVAFVAYNDNTFNVVTDPLPVTLLWFTANPVQQEVQLSWQTLTESGTDHFAVEVSTDGIQFATIGTVRAAGNSTDGRQYALTHSHPTAGTSWYRLKMVDENGSIHYSEVVTVKLSATAGFSMRLYPNPASEKIVVQQRPSSTNSVYQVRTLSGLLMLQETAAPGTRQQQIDIGSLPKGPYLLIHTAGTAQTVARFIKN